jgi:hypothetical protein
MIDWTKPLTLCWCGFEFHGTQYPRPSLSRIAKEIDSLHLKTHQIETQTALVHKRRKKLEEFIRTIPKVEFDPNIIAGRDDRQ